MAPYGPMGKWPWRCTSTGQGSSKELDLEWICPVVAGSQHPQDSMSPYHAHGHAHMGKWPSLCASTGQDGSNEFDLEWIGWVPASTRFQGPLSCPYGHAHYAPMGKWQWHCTSTGQLSSNELDLEWIDPVDAKFWHLQDFKGLYHAHGNAHYAHMGQWPWRCTSTGKNDSKELDLEWIGPVVAEFRRPQDSKGLYHAHGHAHYAPMGKWPWCCTSTGQDGSNELDLAWIGSVVTELQHPQSLSWTNGRTDIWTKEGTDGQRAFHSPPFFLRKGWETIIKLSFREDLKESKIWKTMEKNVSQMVTYISIHKMTLRTKSWIIIFHWVQQHGTIYHISENQQSYSEKYKLQIKTETELSSY